MKILSKIADCCTSVGNSKRRVMYFIMLFGKEVTVELISSTLHIKESTVRSHIKDMSQILDTELVCSITHYTIKPEIIDTKRLSKSYWKKNQNFLLDNLIWLTNQKFKAKGLNKLNIKTTRLQLTEIQIDTLRHIVRKGIYTNSKDVKLLNYSKPIRTGTMHLLYLLELIDRDGNTKSCKWTPTELGMKIINEGQWEKYGNKYVLKER